MDELFGIARCAAAVVLGIAAGMGLWIRPKATPECWSSLDL